MPTAPEVDFAAQLRGAGVRVTRPRMAVLRLLHETGGHRSADDVFDALQKRGVRLPRASVYNVLNDLFDHGLVMRVDVGPGSALYEASTQWHHHFVCRQCGFILDVPCAAGSKPCMLPTIEGLLADEAQVIFRGACPFASGTLVEAFGGRPPCCRIS